MSSLRGPFHDDRTGVPPLPLARAWGGQEMTAQQPHSSVLRPLVLPIAQKQGAGLRHEKRFAAEFSFARSDFTTAALGCCAWRPGALTLRSHCGWVNPGAWNPCQLLGC